MAESELLSIQLPAEVHARIEAVAARHGKSVGEFLGEIVERFLSEQSRQPPDLSSVLVRLRGKAVDLRQRGISGLWVFGSTARGDARPDSDIDLIAEFAPEARVSMTGFASLRADLADLLKWPVDLAEWQVLRPPVLDAARREAVRVF